VAFVLQEGDDAEVEEALKAELLRLTQLGEVAN
jgi:hypothetical protein